MWYIYSSFFVSNEQNCILLQAFVILNLVALALLWLANIDTKLNRLLFKMESAPAIGRCLLKLPKWIALMWVLVLYGMYMYVRVLMFGYVHLHVTVAGMEM